MNSVLFGTVMVLCYRMDYLYECLHANCCRAGFGHRLVTEGKVVAFVVAADWRREVSGFIVGENEDFRMMLQLTMKTRVSV